MKMQRTYNTGKDFYSIFCKKIFLLPFFAVMLLCASAMASPVQTGSGFVPAGNAGGFSGPSIATTTVEQAKNMRDDSKVLLRGSLMQHLGGEDYLFKDATGTIRVEIDHNKWNGQTISPNDVVEIHGEVDKDWNSVSIDVDSIIKK